MSVTRLLAAACLTLGIGILAAGAGFSLAFPAFAHEIDTSNTGVSDFSYEVRIENAPVGQEKALLALTEAEKQKSNPPPTVYLLQRRLDNDTEILKKALAATGYYDARITTSLETEEIPYQAGFHVEAGERYILESILILLDERSESADAQLPDPDTLGLAVGGAVNYETIQNTRNTVRNRMYEANCLRTVRVRSHLRVDTERKVAQAVYQVRAGENAVFGRYTIEGLETIRQPYVDRKIPWEQGECYKPGKLEDLQVSLLQTNLFSTTDIKPAEEVDEEGEFPVYITVRERPQRTVKAGIGYSTQDGVDFKPSWEHRNFFGEGEKVTIESTLSTFLQTLKGRLERPDFLRKSQTLVLESEIGQSSTDAYDSTSLRALAQLTRPIGKNLTGGFGVAYALKQVDEEGLNNGEDTFSLLSFPGFVEHNTRDSVLDPTRGHVLRLDIEPFVETLNTGDMFLKKQASARFYHQHEHVLFKPVWAFRALVGSISGSAASDVPADERFFSGGGGSVRGYGYQSLRGTNGDAPDGGRSLLEFSAELRLRVTDSIGLVPFVDAGNVYNSVYPDFDGDLFYAAGLGVRYHTDFGPFRVDVAKPLDRRHGTDDAVQLYISFGQAF